MSILAAELVMTCKRSLVEVRSNIGLPLHRCFEYQKRLKKTKTTLIGTDSIARYRIRRLHGCNEMPTKTGRSEIVCSCTYRRLGRRASASSRVDVSSRHRSRRTGTSSCCIQRASNFKTSSRGGGDEGLVDSVDLVVIDTANEINPVGIGVQWRMPATSPTD